MFRRIAAAVGWRPTLAPLRLSAPFLRTVRNVGRPFLTVAAAPTAVAATALFFAAAAPASSPAGAAAAKQPSAPSDVPIGFRPAAELKAGESALSYADVQRMHPISPGIGYLGLLTDEADRSLIRDTYAHVRPRMTPSTDRLFWLNIYVNGQWSSVMDDLDCAEAPLGMGRDQWMALVQRLIDRAGLYVGCNRVLSVGFLVRPLNAPANLCRC
jgi:hypothetical protein